MDNIKNFRGLIVYQKAVELVGRISNEDLLEEEMTTLRRCSYKMTYYIAHAQGVSLYPNNTSYYYKQSIKWLLILEKELKKIKNKIAECNNYLNKITEIRKILFALKNKEDKKVLDSKYELGNKTEGMLKDTEYIEFRKVRLYQLSLQLHKECLEIIDTFPKHEEDLLKHQLRKISQAILAQYVEGYNQFYLKREINFLSITAGSVAECRAHLDIAKINNYITESKFREIDSLCEQIVKLTYTHRKKLIDTLNQR